MYNKNTKVFSLSTDKFCKSQTRVEQLKWKGKNNDVLKQQNITLNEG